LLTWCVSTTETCSPRRQRSAHLLRQLQHHLHADRKIRPVQQPRLLALRQPAHVRSLSYQPVVPTTIFAPVARHARMFCTTASGVVKSITTSNPATNGGVSAVASGILLRIQHVHAVAALRRHLRHQLAGLALSEHQYPHG
jgi:hypothetical protein